MADTARMAVKIRLAGTSGACGRGGDVDLLRAFDVDGLHALASIR